MLELRFCALPLHIAERLSFTPTRVATEVTKSDCERKTNSEAKRMDSQRAAGQGDAKAHSETNGAPYGRPQAP